VIVEIALMAFLVDKIFGEFRFIPHPVVLMGNYIKWFEKKFYKESVFSGAMLIISLLVIVYFIVMIVLILTTAPIVLGIIASSGIASNMLYKSVKDVIESDEPKKAISMLVSRDTENLNQSDINKAAIETYAENLSDGVIAPLFYLLFFGLGGLFIYKAINTLDSMVGYRNERYEKFGKFSAKLDDIANYIPARITALLIAFLFFSRESFITAFFKYAYLHESPNAGYPISAMGGAIGVKLGGPTSYFGKIKDKPFLSDGKEVIEKEDVKTALSLHVRLDILIILFLGGLYGLS
jgi:adenosylcobinamide-phosphate synthase